MEKYNDTTLSVACHSDFNEDEDEEDDWITSATIHTVIQLEWDILNALLLIKQSSVLKAIQVKAH